jgi:hypothetical protein
MIVQLAKIREGIEKFYAQYWRLPRIRVPEKRGGGNTIKMIVGESQEEILVEVCPDLRELGVFPGQVSLS